MRGKLDARVLEGLDDLVRDQIMSMKTTFTPGHYRRRVAGVLARRLMVRLFGRAEGSGTAGAIRTRPHLGAGYARQTPGAAAYKAYNRLPFPEQGINQS